MSAFDQAVFLRAIDELKAGDTDRPGHIDKANLAIFYEAGRVELLNNPLRPIAQSGSCFVAVDSGIDIIFEVLWPGEVSIKTDHPSGRASRRLWRAIFQHARNVSVSVSVSVSVPESVAVLVDATMRRATPILDAARSFLEIRRRAESPLSCSGRGREVRLDGNVALVTGSTSRSFGLLGRADVMQPARQSRRHRGSA